MGILGNRDFQWVSKNSNSNCIKVGYYRMEQIREGVSGDGLNGNFWEEGQPPCIQSQLVCLHRWSAPNLLWQLVPVRDYPNAESMLAAIVFTPLLVNLESMTSRPNAAGQQKVSCMESWVGRALFYTFRSVCNQFCFQNGFPDLILGTKSSTFCNEEHHSQIAARIMRTLFTEMQSYLCFAWSVKMWICVLMIKANVIDKAITQRIAHLFKGDAYLGIWNVDREPLIPSSFTIKGVSK